MNNVAKGQRNSAKSCRNNVTLQTKDVKSFTDLYSVAFQ